MSFEYRTVNLSFKNRWTNSGMYTELDDKLNCQAIAGLELLSVKASQLYSHSQSTV
jgi:hypothetical protein